MEYFFFEDNEPYCIGYERCLEMPIDSFDVVFFEENNVFELIVILI
jgi:hypothetical protein